MTDDTSRAVGVGRGEGRSASPPGRAAYLALLSVTSLGTISSTIMSAPINEIAAAIGTDGRGIVLAVSAFTVVMALTSPAAGWLADRMGPRAYLFVSLVLMIAGQVLAGVSTNLTMLVVARSVQGAACSGIPACVQYLLAGHWPLSRRQSMAAWASAIGVGQAIGPPTGGAVAQLLGWRWVFGAAALVVIVVLLVLVRTLPEVAAETDAVLVDTGALVVLTVGGGLLAVGLTAIGQGYASPSVAVTALGALVLAVVLRPGRRPPVLGPVGRDPGYAVATLSAAAAMATLGITVVSVPVYLGTRLGLGPGLIGLSTLALALGMTTFAPIAGRVAGRVGTRSTLAGGLLSITLIAPVLGVVEGRGEDTSILPALLVVLLAIGCGIATIQSMSALVLLDVPGRSGTSMGVHNMGRFTGLCAGYGWVAFSLPLDRPLLIHLGTAVMALVSLVALVVAVHRGSRVSPRPDPRSGRPAATSR